MQCGGVCAFLEYSLVNFLPVYRDLRRRLDSNKYLMTFHAQYGHCDIVTDDNFSPHYAWSK